MTVLSLLRNAYATGGLRRVARRAPSHVYRRVIRPIVPPKGWATYNGVRVAVRTRWFDAVLPYDWSFAHDRPGYESALIGGLRRHVHAGDTVVVVGGGWGATAVVAAESAGPDGHMTVYEGAREAVANTRWAALHAEVSDRVTIHQAIVAAHDHDVAPERLRGSGGGARRVDPSALPPCDVLELNCEGAEIGILTALPFRPRVILVETHGAWGSPTPKVRHELEGLGYTVTSQVPASSELVPYCLENDIFVIEAVQASPSKS